MHSRSRADRPECASVQAARAARSTCLRALACAGRGPLRPQTIHQNRPDDVVAVVVMCAGVWTLSDKHAIVGSVPRKAGMRAQALLAQGQGPRKGHHCKA